MGSNGRPIVFVRLLAIAVCVVAFSCSVIGVALSLITGNDAAQRDIVSYWTAAHLFVEHSNPYDVRATAALQHALGLQPGTREVIMRNPPWTLPFVLPLSAFHLRLGSLVWSLLLILCFAYSLRLLWTMLGRPRGYFLVVCAFFAPAIVCLLASQSSLIALLGIVLFLRFHNDAPFLAGASLYLCSIKPHLFLPFAVVLLLWVLSEKRFAVLLGAITAICAASALVTAYHPFVWSEYWHTMTTWGIERETIPCLSVLFQRMIKPGAQWLQYLPACLAGAWAFRYYMVRRDQWDWMQHGNAVLLVSVMTAPYAWFIDEVVLLPLIAWVVVRSRPSILLWVAFLSAIMQLETVRGLVLHSWAYIWTAPAWLALFLYTRKRSGQALPYAHTGAAPQIQPSA